MDQLIEFAGNHPMLSGGFVAVLALLIWIEITRRISSISELSTAQAVAWMNDPQAVVVDVSPVADFGKGHIVGARNIQMSRIAKPDREMQKLSGKKVLVVCKNGQTAHQAAAGLKKAGVAELAVLKGGLAQWKADQYPVTRD